MATAGVTVGSVWLDVLPSMRNFGGELVSQTESAARTAGQRSGEALGDGTERGFRGKMATVAAAGAAIGLAVGSAISSALDISDARARLSAQLGLSSADSERYGRIAGQVYSNAYGESLDQVNEAIAAVHRNIGENLNDADLQNITSTVLSLASTFQVDLGGATAAVGQMMKTGMAPNAQAALDVITAGFQSGVDKSGDFLDTLNEYGTQFRKLGLDGQTATGLLSQGLQAGARDADVVADALKEFSIRAVDGSKTTVEGFQAIGLNADQMASQIAKGGPAASAGLDVVLERLRAMPDPVERSRAAVNLFGTQAEDLGDALFALDPSTAVNALGQVGGAAERMNTTLGETASSRLQSFTRTLQTGLVDFLGGTVLPMLDTVSAYGATLFGPAWEPVRSFLGFLAGTGGVVAAVILTLAGATWVWTTAMGALSAASLPITGTALAIAAGIGVLIAVVLWAWNNFEGFRNVVLGVWSAVQSAFSIAWSVIQSVFAGIVSAASAVGSGLSTALSAAGSAASVVGSIFAAGFALAVGALQAVGTAASWLWNTILSPVFSAIGLAARVLVAIVVTLLVAPIVIAFNLLGAAATWLWEVAIRPAWQSIQDFLSAAASVIDAVVLTPLRAGLALLGAATSAFVAGAVGAWQALQAGLAAAWSIINTAVFQPIATVLNVVLAVAFSFFRDQATGAWQSVQAALSVVWSFIRDFIFQPIVAFLQATLGPAFTIYRDLAIAAWNLLRDGVNAAWSFIRDNIWQPIVNFLTGPMASGMAVYRDLAIAAWNTVRDALSAAWGVIRDNIWQPLVNFVTQTIPNAFQTASDAIGRAWETVKQKVRDPIEAVVNVVYNQGIVKVWNWVAGLVGLGPLSEWHVPAFARGGAVTGGVAGKDSVLLAAMPGEYVLSKSAVDAAGGLGAVEALHRGLRGGGRRGAENLFRLLGIPGFADGGPVSQTDSGGNSLGSLWEAVTGGIAKVGELFGSTQWGQMAIGLVKKLADGLWPALLSKVTGWFASLFGGGGGEVPAGSGPVVDEVRRAAAAMGWDTGAQWAALSWIISHESGWRPTAQNPTSTAFGLFQFLDSTWATVGGSKTSNPYQQAVYGMRYISQRYGTPTGAQAFWQANGFYDQGGLLPTGWSNVYNGTGRPEPVLTDGQWKAITEGTGGTDGAALEAKLDELVDVVRAQQPAQITVQDHSGNPVETARATQLALRLAR